MHSRSLLALVPPVHALSILLGDLGAPEHPVSLLHNQIECLHSGTIQWRGEGGGPLWLLFPIHVIEGGREDSSPALWFHACPCDLRCRLGIAEDVFLACLLAGSMGCLMKILLAVWILLKPIFWFIPSIRESQLIIIGSQHCWWYGLKNMQFELFGEVIILG